MLRDAFFAVDYDCPLVVRMLHGAGVPLVLKISLEQNGISYLFVADPLQCPRLEAMDL